MNPTLPTPEAGIATQMMQMIRGLLCTVQDGKLARHGIHLTLSSLVGDRGERVDRFQAQVGGSVPQLSAVAATAEEALDELRRQLCVIAREEIEKADATRAALLAAEPGPR